jgi:hypothetical protein
MLLNCLAVQPLFVFELFGWTANKCFSTVWLVSHCLFLNCLAGQPLFVSKLVGWQSIVYVIANRYSIK